MEQWARCNIDYAADCLSSAAAITMQIRMYQRDDWCVLCQDCDIVLKRQQMKCQMFLVCAQLCITCFVSYISTKKIIQTAQILGLLVRYKG